MTNERENEVRDELVSKTYRELDAVETPEYLNRKVLQMAAAEAGQSTTARISFPAWMKPAAWTATIGLSLAIVMEFSEIPHAPERLDDAIVDDLGRIEAINEQIMPASADVLEQTERPVKAAALPGQKPERRGLSAASAATSDHDESVLNRAVIVEHEEKSKDIGQSEPVPASPQPAARKLAVDQPAVSSPSLEQVSDERQEERVRASFAVISDAKKESDDADACDTAARQASADWLQCIEKLRETGAVAAAEREFEAFLSAYPAESGGSDPE
jgi:hypothetical protein